MQTDGTKRLFGNMLNEYLHYPLLIEEIQKRDYLLGKVEKDLKWSGGTLVVPFKSSSASTINYGKLASINDITSNKYVRGEVSSPGELWGSLEFYERDLFEHNGSINEKSFLNRLTDEIDTFMSTIKESLSTNLLSGKHLGLTNDVDSGPVAAKKYFFFEHPERLQLGQKIVIQDPETRANKSTVSIEKIDINKGKISVDSNIKSELHKKGMHVYQHTANESGNKFLTLREQLLSSENGGYKDHLGKTKEDYPFLQAIQHSGSSIDGTNILDTIYDAYTKSRKIGKGNPNTCLVNYKHMSAIAKKLEDTTAPYKHMGSKISLYDFEELTVSGIKGQLNIVAVPEMPSDLIYLLDWRGLKLHSNNMFNIRTSPEGQKYHEVRTEEGYKYIVDIRFTGQLVVRNQSYQCVIHDIPEYN